MIETLNRFPDPLPLPQIYSRNGESQVYTPWAVRCQYASLVWDPHPIVYLTEEQYHKGLENSLRFYQNEEHFDCPRCGLMSGATLIPAEENPPPALLALPVLQESPRKAHAALVAALQGHEWCNGTYFARDLSFWLRQEVESAPEETLWIFVAKESGITGIRTDQPLAPERLESEIYTYKDALLFCWGGELVVPVSAEEAIAFLAGEDGNRTVNDPRPITVKLSLPSESALRASLPFSVRQKLGAWEEEQRRKRGWGLRERYQDEVDSLLSYAKGAKEPTVSMTLFEKGGGNQWICYFAVKDLAKPLKDEWSWHLINTSQLSYSGALVVSETDGSLSSHH